MTPAIKKWLNKPHSLFVGVSAIEIFEEEHQADQEHHLHGRVDPHILHDPINTQKFSELIF